MLLKHKFAKIFGITSFACWNILGFKRGIDNYDYFYDNKDNYLYSKKITTGLAGTLIYTVFFPFVICRELCKLEVNIRGLKKDSDYYSI